MEEKKVSTSDVENILRILDEFAAGGESRMKLFVSDSPGEAAVRKVHHHGRCDIGSPWATGECYDGPDPD